MNSKYKALNRALMRSIILIFILASGLRCSVHEDVSDVRRTSKQVKKTAEAVSESVNKIRDRTEDIYYSTREVVSLYNQNVSFQDILGANGVSNKLLQASIFFASMEFQHWRKGKGAEEQLDSREELMTNSVRYFFWKIDDLIGDSPDVEVPYLPNSLPFLGRSQSNWVNLSVLAVAMGHVHESQLREARTAGVKIYSIYDIIKESLLLKPLYEAGESVPSYVVEVLRYEESAKFLLQLRHNFYALIVASRLSNFEENFWTQLRHLFWGWEVDPSQFNRAQYEMFGDILDRGFETKLFLNQIQEPVQVAKVVERLFKNLTWVIVDDEPFKSLIKQMGMIPSQDQVKRFQIRLDYQPSVNTLAEKLVVDLNSYTGSTLFVFNREAHKRAQEEDKENEDKPWWKIW